MIMKISKGFTFSSIVPNVSWILLLSIVILHVCAGYIINENGQLVPFKIYKKGNHGSRVMCFLHPRNCRGGFHKRLIEEVNPVKGGLKDLYELKVYKRKYKSSDKNSDLKSSYKTGETALYNSKSLTNVQPSNDKQIHDDNVLDLFPSLKTKYLEGEIDGFHYSGPNMKLYEDMKEANQILNDLHKGLGNVADPPPLQTEPHLRATLEEYPVYELWGDYNSNYEDSADHITDDYLPSQSVDLYAFRRQK